MKKKVLGLAAASLLAGSITAYAGVNTGWKFSDIENSFAKDDINHLAELGIVKGKRDWVFAPKDNITREEEAAIINRLLKIIEEKDAELAAKIEALKPAPPQPPAQPAPPVAVENPGDYIAMEDLSQGENGWNVGFNIDHESLPYSKIRSITVALLDADGNAIATRVAMTTQIDVLRDSDITYGGMDGQLSAFFKGRAVSESNDYWTSTPYDLTAPSGASVTIITTDGKVYKVSR